MDSASGSVVDGDGIVAAVAKVNLDVGTVAGRIGIELAESLFCYRFLDGNGMLSGSIGVGVNGIEQESDVVGGAWLGAEIIVVAVEVQFGAVVVE